MKKLYNKKLANEWIEWVETSNPEGTREQEIFPFIKKWITETKPKSLADIGCGQGSCSELIGKGIGYIGIDQSPVLIARAKRLYPEPNKKFIEGEAYNLPFEDNSIDAIMSVWVWSHLDNLELAAKEMIRVLKPSGNFLIITANPETYDERKTFYKKYKIQGKLLTGTFDLGHGKVLTDTTFYMHTKKEIEHAIKKAEVKAYHVKRMGQAKSSDKGLYLVIQGKKD